MIVDHPVRSRRGALLAALCAAAAAVLVLCSPVGTSRALAQSSPATAAADPLDAVPAIGERPEFSLPAVERFTLGNGLEVWHVHQPTVPMVTLSLVVPYGSAVDPEGREGLASVTADMLDEGTVSRSALELADAFDILGSTLSTGADRDLSRIELESLSRNLEPSLALLADVVLRPRFAPEDFERVQKLRLAELDQRSDDPGALSRLAAARAWFGEGHPYAHPPEGQPQSVSAMDAGDVIAFWSKYWRPETARLVVVGDVDGARLRALLEDTLGGWTPGMSPAPLAVPEPPPGRGTRLVVVPRPNAPQTVVRIVLPGAARSDASRIARERVLNTLYGGAFTSRLMQNLREEKSWTYGARSAFGALRGAGTFMSWSSIEAPHTGPAVAEFRKELARLAAGDIAADELQRSLATLHADTVQAFEMQGSVVRELSTLALYGQEPALVDAVLEVADGLTLDELNAFAREVARTEQALYVLVGDPELIAAQLADAGLPAAELWSRDGAPQAR